MLCVWIFLFLTSGIIAQSHLPDDDRCIMPPSDIVKNGTFFVDKWFGSLWTEDSMPPSGTKLLSYELEFQCDPGFFLRGNPYVRCVPAQMEEFPECSDTCEPTNPECPVQSDGISANLDGDTGSNQCGIVNNAPTALAGGRIAVLGDVPWQAAIYDKSTTPFIQVCGGSIVSKDVVISAAHCFKLPDEFYAVAVGKIYRPYNDPLDRAAQKSEVLEVRVPPRYRGSVTSFQDDIAAVILATPIQFTSMILPVCIHFGADFDEVQIAAGMLGRVAGWGIDSINGRPSQLLNLAEMPMVDVGTCFMLQDMSFIQYITSDKICAGYTNGTSLCKGDSGGGLAVPHRSGYTTKYYLRGIVSTGPPPATLNECNVNAVTTFTRVAKHEYFIKSAIARKPLQESERRIPDIIPANFLNSNQNILGNIGVNEETPLKADPLIQMDTFNDQRPVFGNSNDPLGNAPGTVVVKPDILPIDGNRNTQVPLRNDPVQQTDVFNNQRPVFGISNDPQGKAPSTVVVIPNILSTDGNRNTPDPLRDDSVQQTDIFTNQRPVFGNTNYPQGKAPGTVVVIPDTLPTDVNRNTQVPLRNDPVQQTDTFNNQRPVFGISNDPQGKAPGTVVVIPDILPTDGNRNTQVHLRSDPVQQTDTNQRPVFGNTNDPQGKAPGTVVVIPDILPKDGNRNTQVPQRGNPVQTNNERPVIGSFGNSRDSQGNAPGSVQFIPDILPTDDNRNIQFPLRGGPVKPTDIFNYQRPVFSNNIHSQGNALGTLEDIPNFLNTDGNRNTQVPLRSDPVPPTDIFNYQRPVFGNSIHPQGTAPGSGLFIPNILPTDGYRNIHFPLRGNPVQRTDIFYNQRPVFGNSYYPQSVEPGTVVVIPDILQTNFKRNTQDPLRTVPVKQTNVFTNQRPVLRKRRDSQAGAPGTVVVILDSVPIDANKNTKDSLLEDAVQPVRIFENQRPAFGDTNIPTPGTVADILETLINTKTKNDERPVQGSFIPKPVAGLDENDKVSTDSNGDNKVPTIVISEGVFTTPSPQLHHSAPDYSNYQHLPPHPNTPYQYNVSQNWQYSSQNGDYPTQNGQDPSQSGHHPSQNEHYSSQNGHYSSQNEHQNSQNVNNNGYFGHRWQYNNTFWNSHYHHDQWWRKD